MVPYSRMGDFDISEVLCNQETGEPIILPEGTFVYRLNGRDRQKSASYYTPEVLTRSTVKYTLKAIIDDVAANKRKATELLDLKILEPAMGAAAFQNEVINESAITHIDPQTGLPHVARPDRVIRRDDKITVIDYKFANSRTTHRSEEYKEQVQLYIQLLHQMNPTLSVKGYLWYIYDNAVVEVPFQKEGGQR